jgi:hypothetical protein
MESKAASWGRIGGLVAWSRNDPAVMVGPAHRGFKARFERLVDPAGVLDPAERTVRADRARRAYMLTLAERSAEARRKKAGPGRDSGPASSEARDAAAEPTS